MSADSSLGSSRDRLKIILGIDFGTTFTGVSYVTSDKTSIHDIDCIRTWPGKGCPVEGNWKTPSIIAYKSENEFSKRDHWGYEVQSNMASCSWMKLLLDTSAETAEFDDPELKDATGLTTGIFRLPKNMTAEQVCQDYLSNVYRYIVKNLKMRMGEETATRNAAMRAGFGSRPGDVIRMITEPEAAAIAALKSDLKPGSINMAKAGDNILILDCGGGTVDITTYKVRRTEPTLSFEEICVGAGGKCGSTYIDRNFHRLLSLRFPKAFDKIPAKCKAPGSKFMMEFEQAKMSFGSSSDMDTYEIGPLALNMRKGSYNPAHYDKEERAVILSTEDMRQLFTPVVGGILRLLSQQVDLAMKDKKRKINLIVIVGGFGNSDYLMTSVEEWARPHRIKCIRPNFCQAAIVRGAAIRGLEGTMPTTRLCRRHYGFSRCIPFLKGIHKEENAHMSFGEKFSWGHMKWVMKKGGKMNQVATRDYAVESTFFSRADGAGVEIFCCHDNHAPGREDDSGVERLGSLTVDLAGIDPTLCESRIHDDWRREYRVGYVIRVDFRSEIGVIQFTAMKDGEEIGNTTVNFE